MIKILILTDKMNLWRDLVLKNIHIDRVCERKDSIILQSRMFTFLIKTDINEYMRGASYAHVILDKEIDDRLYYEVLMPTIKQRVSQYGLHQLFEN